MALAFSSQLVRESSRQNYICNSVKQLPCIMSPQETLKFYLFISLSWVYFLYRVSVFLIVGNKNCSSIFKQQGYSSQYYGHYTLLYFIGNQWITWFGKWAKTKEEQRGPCFGVLLQWIRLSNSHPSPPPFYDERFLWPSSTHVHSLVAPRDKGRIWLFGFCGRTCHGKQELGTALPWEP